MSAPRIKRPFAGAASDASQRHITSYFSTAISSLSVDVFGNPFVPEGDEGNTINNTFGAGLAATPSQLQQHLPPAVQANLLSVGMRVRKSVPEGYKTTTGKAFPDLEDFSDEESPFALYHLHPTTSAAMSSAVVSGSSGGSSASSAVGEPDDRLPHPPPQPPMTGRPRRGAMVVPSTSTSPQSSVAAAPRQQHELAPFCGLHRVGGLAAQGSDGGDVFGPSSSSSSLPSSLPSLASSSSQASSLSSVSSASSSSLGGGGGVARQNSRKRVFEDDETDDGAARSGRWGGGGPGRLLDGEVSPRSLGPRVGSGWGLAAADRRSAAAAAADRDSSMHQDDAANAAAAPAPSTTAHNARPMAVPRGSRGKALFTTSTPAAAAPAASGPTTSAGAPGNAAELAPSLLPPAAFALSWEELGQENVNLSLLNDNANASGGLHNRNNSNNNMALDDDDATRRDDVVMDLGAGDDNFHHHTAARRSDDLGRRGAIGARGGLVAVDFTEAGFLDYRSWGEEVEMTEG